MSIENLTECLASLKKLNETIYNDGMTERLSTLGFIEYLVMAVVELTEINEMIIKELERLDRAQSKKQVTQGEC